MLKAISLCRALSAWTTPALSQDRERRGIQRLGPVAGKEGLERPRKIPGVELCDVVMGVPSSLDMVATSKPYYTSTYVFASRLDRELDVASFDDSAASQAARGGAAGGG
ncbi:MAG: hypothetical protein EOO73_11205 [Myxococcales bacterium]|nr:MAG: hypothetical protein EOO73_11205 [Myxococcales bacterium]